MVNVLIVTVTRIEASTVLNLFSVHTGTSWKRQFINGKVYYQLGELCGANIFMVRSEMGSLSPGAALVTILKAIEVIAPVAIIMVGTAFGLKPEKQKLGDILVSCQIRSYEQQKLIGGSVIPRGDRVSSSQKLLGLFRDGDLDWIGADVHFGLIFSGEKLIMSSVFREQLLSIEAEAIGGDMEGAGLYTAANETNVDWILVKGISDWGDETKNHDSQPTASKNAVAFVIHVIKHGGILKSYKQYQGTSHQLVNSSRLASQVDAPSPKKEPTTKSEYIFSRIIKLDDKDERELFSKQNPFIPFLVRTVLEREGSLKFLEVIPIDSRFCYFGRSSSFEQLERYIKHKRLNASKNTLVLLPALKIAKGNSRPAGWLEIVGTTSFLYSGWGNRSAQENIQVVDTIGNIHNLLDSKPYSLHGFEIIHFMGQPQSMYFFIPMMASINCEPYMKYIELIESLGLWASAGYGWLNLGLEDRALFALKKAIDWILDDEIKNNILSVISQLNS